MRYLFFLLAGLIVSLSAFAQLDYTVNVQVVDLLISVSDRQGNFIKDISVQDFQVREDGIVQEILDLELKREPFSVGVLVDTSSSMQSTFRDVERAAMDFIYSLNPEDEFFIMTFDDKIQVQQELTPASLRRMFEWKDLRYGDRTRLYDAALAALGRLEKARYPRRALFLLSDGVNTSGESGLGEVIRTAQKNKTLVYSYILERAETNLNVMRMLSMDTGGTFFAGDKNFPRLRSAYKKIAGDLANRFTLYYRSGSNYSLPRKPEIQVLARNPEWKLRYQRTYYPNERKE